MSLDDRLREAFAADQDLHIDVETSLTGVHAAARRQTLRTRAAVGCAAFAAIAATVVAATLLGRSDGSTVEPAEVPTSSPTSAGAPDPSLEHHQGRWETRDLTRADFAQTLADLGASEWYDELVTSLPEGTMRLVQVVDGQDWTLSVVAGDDASLLDRRTIAAARFMTTASVAHPESRATFNHSSTEKNGIRVNNWKSVKTSGPEYGDLPVRVYLNALYTTARFWLVTD